MMDIAKTSRGQNPRVARRCAANASSTVKQPESTKVSPLDVSPTAGGWGGRYGFGSMSTKGLWHLTEGFYDTDATEAKVD
ncbi:MAG: hypothetical protein AAF939_22340 [Planctomycetota bacterium]